MTKPLRIGIAGLGTVGGGIIELIEKNSALLAMRAGREIIITGVSARKRQRNHGPDISRYTWFDDAVSLAQSPEIDVFVEMIGGEEGKARASVEAALSAGKSVVTANKALLAHHGSGLARAAEARGLSLNFEAAVAGGIPVIKALREGLAGNRITRLFGIMNGTCNYILTKMADEQRRFADVLREAQELGYAEADPTFDVGGFDTAHKLAVITALAFGTEVNLKAIEVEGIESITLEDIRNADDLGYKIKLLGVAVAHDNGIEQRVHPALVPKTASIAETDGVFNAVVMKGDFVGDVLLEGRGAGSHPTASAAVADIVDVALGNRRFTFGVPAKDLIPCTPAPDVAHRGGYYMALELLDKPGSVAAIASKLSEQNISIESIVQHGYHAEVNHRQTAPFILITHDTRETDLRRAIAAIEKDGHVACPPRVIRIERL